MGLEITVSPTASPFIRRDWSSLGINPVNYTTGVLAEDAKLMVASGTRHAAFTSEYPTPANQTAKLGILQFPIFAAAVVMQFNIPLAALPSGVTIKTGAKMKRDTLVKIYTGVIRYWNDTALRTIFTYANSTVRLNAVIPGQPISIFVREGANGPNLCLQAALSKFNKTLFDVTPGADPENFLKYNPDTVNASAADDATISKFIESTPWSIGHALLASALTYGADIFALENANGLYVMPTATVQADTMEQLAFDEALYMDPIDMAGPNIYPLYSVTYATVKNVSLSCDLARQFFAMWEWIAFSQQAKDALDIIYYFKLRASIWQASLPKIHAAWYCTNADGTISRTSPAMFKRFRTTSISRNAFDELAEAYVNASRFTTIAFVDKIAGATDSGHSSLEVLGNTAAQCVVLPLAATALTFAYNTPYSTSSGELQLTREALVGIFNGTISTWDHPVLTTANGFLPLPGDPIVIVLRGNSAGFQLTSILYSVLSTWSSEWRKTYGTILPDNLKGDPTSWLAGVPASRKKICDVAGSSCQMFHSVATTQHTITFSGLSLPRRKGLFIASVQNAAGKFVVPDSAAITKSTTGAAVLNESILVSPTDSSAYAAVYIASFRTPLVHASSLGDGFHDAKTFQYTEEAMQAAQKRAEMTGLVFTQAAFEKCPDVVVELEFVIWAAFDSVATGALLKGDFISVSGIDTNWRQNLLAIKCSPPGAQGSEMYRQAVSVFATPQLTGAIQGSVLNVWILIGLGFAFFAIILGAFVAFALWSRRQLKMVQELSLAVATFDLASMEWLERKPARGIMGCYKQILLNMKVYKQYLPSSLTERHAKEIAEMETPEVTTPGVAIRGSIPEARTSSSIERGDSIRKSKTKKQTESSGTPSVSRGGYSAAGTGARLCRGTFFVLHFHGWSETSNDQQGSKQQIFNSCYAVINKFVTDKRGIVEDFNFERVVCHWNIHRNVGDYRLLASECAVALQNELLHHIQTQGWSLNFDICISSGEIALTSIGNDSKQRITWTSKAWARIEPMHAFNLMSGTVVSVDETTKSAIEYSVDCLLVDVITQLGTIEAIFVYELGGTAMVEDGEWMYHNQIRTGVHVPEVSSQSSSRRASTANVDVNALSALVPGKKDNTRKTVLMAWSSIVTCLCVRRNKAQASQQLDAFLQKPEVPSRLRVIALEMKNFVACNGLPSAPSSGVVSPTSSAAFIAPALSPVGSSSMLPTVGSGYMARELNLHTYLPITFQWMTHQPQPNV